MVMGRTALVIETEFIIALAIQTVLEARFSATVITVATAEEAMVRSPEWAGAWIAIIELETKRPDLIELAMQLYEGGIPVLGISADTALARGMPELPGTPVLIKPVPDDDLVAAVSTLRPQYPLPDVT